MRFERLHLERYGIFEDVSFDFGGADGRLQAADDAVQVRRRQDARRRGFRVSLHARDLPGEAQVWPLL